MSIVKRLILLSSSLWICITSYSQGDSTKKLQISLFNEAGLSGATSNQTPFWITTNQNGVVPKESNFGFLRTGATIVYQKKPFSRKWKVESEVFFNFGKTSSLILPVANAAFQYKGLEIYAGRRKEIFGLCDSVLTSGSYIWSGNSLPIPKIQIGTNGFIPLKFTEGFLAIQGTFAHGWFGNGKFASNYYLHQKTAYLRLGKAPSRIKVYLGVAHFAQWGGSAPILIGTGRSAEDGTLPSTLKDFGYVIIAKQIPPIVGLNSYDAENRIGNHVGAIDVAISYRGKKNSWLCYFQHPAENIPGVWSNFPDGLYGLHWQNIKLSKTSSFSIDKIVFECLSTIDQGLFFSSQLQVYHGNDYFNNSQYMDGWSYKNRIIGTPFFSLREDTRNEWFNVRGEYSKGDYRQINNNSVQMVHLGVQGHWKKRLSFTIKVSPSIQYLYGRVDGSFEKTVNQFSAAATISKIIGKNISVSTIVAYDNGAWLPNSFGGYLSIKKTGLL